MNLTQEMKRAARSLRDAMSRAEFVFAQFESDQDDQELAVLGKDAQADINQIVTVVAREFRVSAKMIFGRERTEPLATARLVVVHLVRKRMKLTPSQVGKLFDRDRGTVLYAEKEIEYRSNEDLKVPYARIVSALNGKPQPQN